MDPFTPTDHSPRLAITGLGLVTPLGASAWQTFTALLAGKSIADRAAKLEQDQQTVDPIELARMVGCVSSVQHVALDPAIELAEQAARQALMQARVSPSEFNQIPCYLGVSKGAMQALAAATWFGCFGQRPDSMLRRRLPHLRELAMSPPSDAPLALGLGPVGYLAHHLRLRLGLGPIHGCVAACASSLHALHLAKMALTNAGPTPPPKRVLVVSAEAALMPMFLHSYKRLGVLAELTPAGYRGRPMDQHRTGFMLAEQASALVLESTPDEPELELLDTAIAAEAYHLMQTAPQMPVLEHIAQQLIAHRNINVLHPHATGTLDNDSVELAVYDRILGHRTRPAIYACKGALGHGLGSAGLTSLVLACLSARSGRLPPMPWLTQPVDALQNWDRSCWDRPAGSTATLPSGLGPVHAVFAAGFGGHVAGAVIRHHR